MIYCSISFHFFINQFYKKIIQYYLVEDKTQEEVCKLFKCTPIFLMCWVERYKTEGNVIIHYRKPIAYKVKKEYVKFLVDEIIENYFSMLKSRLQKLHGLKV